MLTDDVVQRCMMYARDNSTGRDGIPYSCWKASGSAGADVLCRTSRSMMNTPLAPPHFNHVQHK
eukprot:4236537-Karenia_brevis.AAC.1